jgi:hypothetical protein
VGRGFFPFYDFHQAENVSPFFGWPSFFYELLKRQFHRRLAAFRDLRSKANDTPSTDAALNVRSMYICGNQSIRMA